MEREGGGRERDGEGEREREIYICSSHLGLIASLLGVLLQVNILQGCKSLTFRTKGFDHQYVNFSVYGTSLKTTAGRAGSRAETLGASDSVGQGLHT
jgi:hypothetical protein